MWHLTNYGGRRMMTIRKENLYLQVIMIQKQMGTPAHMKGYLYLRDCILYVYDDPSLLDNMKKQLYKVVSDLHKTTAFCVEQDIRTAIEATLERGDINYLYMIRGNTIPKDKGKPTNKEFIIAIADLLTAINK